MNLLPRPDRDALERHLAGVLGRFPPSQGLCGLLDSLRAYVLSPGKRIRPQLCVWTWRRWLQSDPADATDGPPADPTSPLYDVACAWELFHLFLLIHDDLIDNADVRRGEPSLHRRLEAMAAPSAETAGAAPGESAEAFGRQLALVAGDLLFSAAMRLFHEADLPGDPYRRALRVFSRVACTTGFGQAIDICQSHAPPDEVREETLLREYHWKTAAYTFEGPMHCGAILAGAGDAALASLSRFALSLGQAYQMHNDLLDLAREAHEGCDLVQGKRTVTLLRARLGMGEARRRDFDRRLAALPRLNGRAVAAAEELRQELHRTDAPAQTRRLIDGFLTRAGESADDAALPPSLARGMAGLLDSLRAGYFA